MKAFQLVHPESAAHATRVDAAIHLEGSRLSARFQVRSARPISCNPDLPLNQPQWGLWDWDVVELFVSCTPGRLPYYEFQVSPLGQHFELEIHEPRKRFNRDFRSGFSYAARRLSATDWDAEMCVSLDRLGWNGDPASVTGNSFAVLGPREARTYWSLFEEQQLKPDFHLPERFHPLG